MSVLLGGIADDFTGATDLANTLLQSGMKAVQVIGVPQGQLPLEDAEAVVVALKSRTAPPDRAVSDSLSALRWLQRLGARQFFFKYCSTFDSTDAGNIGPVADALLDELGGDFATVCPAFPANHRTIYMGHLFVGDQLLNESPMKDHPLTPMRDANLLRLMGAQTDHRVGLVPYAAVQGGADMISREFAALKADGCRYGVVDALMDNDLETIGASVADHPLVTGGSGVARGLPENFRREGLLDPAAEPGFPEVRGKPLVLAGSCSQRTREQIRHVADRWPVRRITMEELGEEDALAGSLGAWLSRQNSDSPVLIYASADPEEVQATQQRYGRERAGQLIEETLGRVAQSAIDQGFRRLIVAGGETSGAVVKALNIQAMRIHGEIDPGVPWTETLSSEPLALALKSGNFGGVDFFERAFSLLP